MDRALIEELVKALEAQGQRDGGFCSCPLNDGSAPESCHATSCTMARVALAKAKAALDLPTDQQIRDLGDA